jgi:hypothetical protein
VLFLALALALSYFYLSVPTAIKENFALMERLVAGSKDVSLPWKHVPDQWIGSEKDGVDGSDYR